MYYFLKFYFLSLCFIFTYSGRFPQIYLIIFPPIFKVLPHFNLLKLFLKYSYISLFYNFIVYSCICFFFFFFFFIFQYVIPVVWAFHVGAVPQMDGGTWLYIDRQSGLSLLSMIFFFFSLNSSLLLVFSPSRVFQIQISSGSTSPN